MDLRIQNSTYTFGLKVRPQMDPGNHVTTWLPIAITTYLLYLSTSGETRKQLQDLFALDPVFAANDALLIQSLQNWTQATLATTTPKTGGTFTISSTIYIQKRFQLKATFIYATSGKFFDSAFEVVDDFGPATQDHINQWASDVTNGKLTSLVTPANLNANSTMLMTSVVYIKLAWKRLFPTRTTLLTFTQSDGKKVSVPFVGYTTPTTLQYLETPDLRYIEVPLKNANWLAYFVIPRGNVTIKALWENRNVMNTLQMKNAATARSVLLRFPKFTVDTTENYMDIFRKLGVNKVFQDDADFSKLTYTNGLHLSQITTRSVITVNQDGVELAAAGMGVGAGVVYAGTTDSVLNVNVDSPFLFAVVNNPNPSRFDMGVLQYHATTPGDEMARNSSSVLICRPFTSKFSTANHASKAARTVGHS
ncbi:hypothetical protein BV898_18683 [Hypsibius exemplaris]|uniref:Serpin domain-containing protein n=1 Tax=Hypsibius exemplaris TaxID=2072580 RepID=A0A9X6RN91_HYPEX|nr:hypothetical protein BV898_18683 [Hypsibius exemplaris]